jgi:cytochrome c553
MLTKVLCIALTSTSLLLVAAAKPDGRGIVENGDDHGAPACVTCHGAKLEGNPAIKAPALAGLTASKILERLDHYAGPDGHNAQMRFVATALTPGEREALAAYIAKLPEPPATH